MHLVTRARRYATTMTGKIRIIGGQWRGRKLAVPDTHGLRPSGDRCRETLFNWLQNYLVGASCLDLFAGSGVLGLEAASRGAGRVVLVERDRQLVEALEKVAAQWPGGDILEVVHDDALAWMRRSQGGFDVVFVDPPFAEGLQSRVLDILVDSGLLNAQALVYVEQNVADDPVVTEEDERFIMHRQKRLGRVNATLLRYAGQGAL